MTAWTPEERARFPERHCLFIPGEPRGADTIFCIKPAKEDSSYCDEHHARCYAIYNPAEVRKARASFRRTQKRPGRLAALL